MSVEHTLAIFLHPLRGRAAHEGRASPPLSANTTELRWGERLRRVIMRLAGRLRLWRRRIAESYELRSLSDRELRDFSVNRYEVHHELRKPIFWH